MLIATFNYRKRYKYATKQFSLFLRDRYAFLGFYIRQIYINGNENGGRCVFLCQFIVWLYILFVRCVLTFFVNVCKILSYLRKDGIQNVRDFVVFVVAWQLRRNNRLRILFTGVGAC